jgi:hypothetical protein
MDVGALAAALIGAKTAQVQLAVAAKMLRMNADAAASAVKVIEAAQQNMESPRQRCRPHRRKPRYFGLISLPFESLYQPLISAHAGTQESSLRDWVPAFAGTSGNESTRIV